LRKKAVGRKKRVSKLARGKGNRLSKRVSNNPVVEVKWPSMAESRDVVGIRKKKRGGKKNSRLEEQNCSTQKKKNPSGFTARLEFWGE